MKRALLVASALLALTGIVPCLADDSSPAIPGSVVSDLDYRKIRDPFKRPILPNEPVQERTPLELIPVSDLSMVGVLKGMWGARALLKSKAGKIFIVSRGTKIGVHDGRVRRILDDRVIVDEITIDILGGREMSTSEIPLVHHGPVGEVSLPAADDLPDLQSSLQSELQKGAQK